MSHLISTESNGDNRFADHDIDDDSDKHDHRFMRHQISLLTIWA